MPNVRSRSPDTSEFPKSAALSQSSAARPRSSGRVMLTPSGTTTFGPSGGPASGSFTPVPAFVVHIPAFGRGIVARHPGSSYLFILLNSGVQSHPLAPIGP